MNSRHSRETLHNQITIPTRAIVIRNSYDKFNL